MNENETKTEMQTSAPTMNQLLAMWFSVESIVKYHNSGDFSDSWAMKAIKDAFDYAKNLQ